MKTQRNITFHFRRFKRRIHFTNQYLEHLQGQFERQTTFFIGTFNRRASGSTNPANYVFYNNEEGCYKSKQGHQHHQTVNLV